MPINSFSEHHFPYSSQMQPRKSFLWAILSSEADFIGNGIVIFSDINAMLADDVSFSIYPWYCRFDRNMSLKQRLYWTLAGRSPVHTDAQRVHILDLIFSLLARLRPEQKHWLAQLNYS